MSKAKKRGFDTPVLDQLVAAARDASAVAIKGLRQPVLHHVASSSRILSDLKGRLDSLTFLLDQLSGKASPGHESIWIQFNKPRFALQGTTERHVRKLQAPAKNKTYP